MLRDRAVGGVLKSTPSPLPFLGEDGQQIWVLGTSGLADQLEIAVKIMFWSRHASTHISLDRNFSGGTNTRTGLSGLINYDSNICRLLIVPSLVDAGRSKWVEVAHLRKSELSIDEMGVIVDDLSESLSRGFFAEVDKELRQAKLSEMSADAIVAVAHLTFAARNQLGSWEEFVSRSVSALTTRGEGNLLEGLN